MRDRDVEPPALVRALEPGRVSGAAGGLVAGGCVSRFHSHHRMSAIRTTVCRLQVAKRAPSRSRELTLSRLLSR